MVTQQRGDHATRLGFTCGDGCACEGVAAPDMWVKREVLLNRPPMAGGWGVSVFRAR